MVDDRRIGGTDDSVGSNGVDNGSTEAQVKPSKDRNNRSVPEIRLKGPGRKSSPRTAKARSSRKKRKRIVRPYPSLPFKEAIQIGEAIFGVAAGAKVRRLTLLQKMGRTPTSSTTQKLITASAQYGVTVGSYAAEFLELTDTGKVACDPAAPPGEKKSARYRLAIAQIEPFALLYETYAGKRLPAHEVMKDLLLDEGKLGGSDPTECLDLFVVNLEHLELIRTIGGAETLISIEQAIEELGERPGVPPARAEPSAESGIQLKPGASKWDAICFYISPIGDEGSEARKHSDLFLSILVEPALKELGLEVVRADKIAEPGMITTHVLEHIKHSRLVVADLSLLNPNVFYEMALRHSVKLPIVQIIRKADKLPFDVNQVNSAVIDNSDIYTFTPKLETYRSEITTLARRALEDPEHVGNPISVFFPGFWE